MAQEVPAGRLAHPRRTTTHEASRILIGFPTEEAYQNAQGDRTDQVPTGAGDSNPSIRERKQRHDHKLDEGLHPVLQAEQRRLDVLGSLLERVERFLLTLAGDDQQVASFGTIEFGDQVAGAGRKLGSVNSCP